MTDMTGARAHALRLVLAWLTWATGAELGADDANAVEREFAGTHTDAAGFEWSGCEHCSGPLTALTAIAGQALIDHLGPDGAIEAVTRDLIDCLDQVGP